MRTYTRVLAKGESGLTREATLQGRQYLVLPVVAIVQGVLQGANSTAPEFASAAEFGANIQGWNGRPVVMDHPQDEDGNYVAANSPGVIDTWAFGWIFNAHIDDDKLKVEAWIDIARAEELGGNFSETLERLRAEETVEVSVGVFINPISKKGKYKGKNYEQVWSNVVPDHLALLSNGNIGACSVSNGCGAPRVEEADPMTTTGVTSGAVDTTTATSSTSSLPPSPTVECSCQHNNDAAPDPSTLITQAVEDPVVDAEREYAALLAGRSTRLSVESLPADRLSSDVAKAITNAIRKKYRGYLYGYTSEFAVYETVDYTTYEYMCMKVGISVDSNMEVTFTSAPVEVTVVMQIIDKPGNVNVMTNPNANPVDGVTPTVATTPPAPAPVVEQKPGTVAAVTLESYLAGAPEEVRGVLQEGMTVLKQRKDSLVKVILATNSGAYTEDELKAMNVDQLGRLAKLAGATSPQQPTDYSGMGGPRLVDNAAPEVFAPAPKKIEWGK
jgi:hypothetical protein